MATQRDRERQERELAEERAAIEEDLHRYDDIDPGLNAACRAVFPDRHWPPPVGQNSGHPGDVSSRLPGTDASPQPALRGWPTPNDFELPEACEVGKKYQPLLRSRRGGRDASEREADLFPILEPYSKLWRSEQRWLWEHRIPRGKLTLLAGDPGVGKSRLALDLAARASAGLPWPGDPQQQTRARGNVVLLTAEDAADECNLPRLERAGADLTRVYHFRCVGARCRGTRKHSTQGFTIPEDVPGLASVLDQYEPVHLVVIDTLEDFWGGRGTHNNAQVRASLAPLISAARNCGTAIVCISHLNKRVGLAGLYRTMGSLAFTAVARAVWGVARDPDDVERRLLLPIKTNLTAAASPLSFRIAEDKLQWETDSPQINWQEAIDTAELKSDLRIRALEFAERWLREALEHGERSEADLVREALQAGIHHGTLIRARKKIRAASKRLGSFENSHWYWRLPE